ncbi:MAG TPA: beta-ketoacyl-[acyl-carrier-protein] synthase II [Sediminispirochaeta sp.]|nr:beta-ketoacyl-[acyl-carrier-protein] synthase II [Sediminispirochaeta sp.]
METARNAVTGIGIYSSIGNNRHDFWNSLIAGASGADHIRGFDTTGYKSKIAAEVKNFTPEQYLSKKRVRRMSRFSQLASCAALQAVEDSGLELEKIDPLRVGAVMGTAAGDYTNLETQHQTLLEKGPGFGHPLAVPMIIPNMSSANIGIDLDIYGPNLGVATACASGAHALAMASLILRSGEADVMLAGGAEAAISPLTVNAYGCMGVLTSRNDDPKSASRPFDAERDGFLIGEGAAVLILETEAHARARGAEILAFLAGAGMTADGYSVAIPEPEGKMAARAMEAAMKQGAISSEEIGYVNAHGTSTPANDRIETLALKQAFGDKAYQIPISSNKSMIGHTLGAAGALEAAATVLTVKEGVLPPTINYQTKDPDCDLDYIPNEARSKRIKAALSNSFGFGGQNCVLAFTSAR